MLEFDSLKQMKIKLVMINVSVDFSGFYAWLRLDLTQFLYSNMLISASSECVYQ